MIIHLLDYYADTVLERTFLFRVYLFCILCYLCFSQEWGRGAFGWHVLERGIGYLFFVDILPIDSYDWG